MHTALPPENQPQLRQAPAQLLKRQALPVGKNGKKPLRIDPDPGASLTATPTTFLTERQIHSVTYVQRHRLNPQKRQATAITNAAARRIALRCQHVNRATMTYFVRYFEKNARKLGQNRKKLSLTEGSCCEWLTNQGRHCRYETSPVRVRHHQTRYRLPPVPEGVLWLGLDDQAAVG